MRTAERERVRAGPRLDSPGPRASARVGGWGNAGPEEGAGSGGRAGPRGRGGAKGTARGKLIQVPRACRVGRGAGGGRFLY